MERLGSARSNDQRSAQPDQSANGDEAASEGHRRSQTRSFMGASSKDRL